MLIASPSDVGEERDAVESAIHEWIANPDSQRRAVERVRGSLVLKCSQVGRRREKRANQLIEKSGDAVKLVGPPGFEPGTNGL